jgi:signal transduction histidine kinase
MAKIQSAPEPNDLVLDDLEKIYNRTRDISKETSAVELDNDFNMVINDLLLSYKTEDVNVITKNNSKIDWEVLSDIKKITVYRVLQELMTNMRKHSKASIVVLSFHQIHKKITISYTDNGVGSSAVKNNGLQNAENRIKAIKGSFTFDSKVNKGFKAQIRV